MDGCRAGARRGRQPLPRRGEAFIALSLLQLANCRATTFLRGRVASEIVALSGREHRGGSEDTQVEADRLRLRTLVATGAIY